MESIKVILKGRVQGVGCRATIRNYIQKVFPEVTGHIKNLPDMSVELLIEGDSDSLQAILTYCQGSPGFTKIKEIETVHQVKIERSDYQNFSIAH